MTTARCRMDATHAFGSHMQKCSVNCFLNAGHNVVLGVANVLLAFAVGRHLM